MRLLKLLCSSCPYLKERSSVGFYRILYLRPCARQDVQWGATLRFARNAHCEQRLGCVLVGLSSYVVFVLLPGAKSRDQFGNALAFGICDDTGRLNEGAEMRL